MGVPRGQSACDDECEIWCAFVRWRELVTPYVGHSGVAPGHFVGCDKRALASRHTTGRLLIKERRVAMNFIWDDLPAMMDVESGVPSFAGAN